MDPQIPPMGMMTRPGPPNMAPRGPPVNFVRPQMGGPAPQGIMNMMPPQMPIMPHESKQKQFACGVYVSGFEKTLTAAMLQEHFKIKPIDGLKLPLTKFKENKGFAFIYYKSEDDAAYVKRTLDHSVILSNEIRVTRIAIAENLSKMIFKMRTKDLPVEEIKQNEALYFNQKNLEKQTIKIIEREFDSFIEVNRINIPHAKDSQQKLKYARVFFYVRNLREAAARVKAKTDATVDLQKTNDYELVLNYIEKIMNEDNDFRKFAKAETYKYAENNRSNILHIKGIKAKPNESMEDLAQELKEFMQDQNKQANIRNCYAAIFQKYGAWASVTFSNYQETKDAYEHFKNNLVKFRDTRVYANIKNEKDLRTVVLSTVNGNVTQNEMGKFLAELAAESNRVDQSDEEKGRKFDFFSFSIVEKKKFYLDPTGKSIGITSDKEADRVMRFNNQVPRRVIIHFIHEINENDLRQLSNSISVKKNSNEIFMIDPKNPIRLNHQKGHIKGDYYIPHVDRKNKGKKLKQRQQVSKPPRENIKRTTGATDFSLRKPGMPNMPIRKGGHQMPGSLGSQPPMKGVAPPKMPMGSMPPNFRVNAPPMMGQHPMGQHPMGQHPMGQPPTMGQQPMGQPPTMGQQPPMGQPTMSQPIRQAYMGPPKIGQPGQQPPINIPMGMNPPVMGQQPPNKPN